MAKLEVKPATLTVWDVSKLAATSSLPDMGPRHSKGSPNSQLVVSFHNVTHV